jgi:hypothetical protein
MCDDRDWEDEFDQEDHCPECDDGNALQSACIDDLCHGGEVPCMHGDWDTLPCPVCGKR